MSRFIAAAADRKLPWDVMGAKLSGQDYPTVADALTASGLDYRTDVWDLYGAPREQASVSAPVGTIHAPSLRTLVRPMPDGTTKVLAACGTRYTPVQNGDAFAVADTLRDEFGSKIIGAADFRSGGASVLVVDMNRPITLNTPNGEVDHTNLNLVIKNAHDGTSALTFALTPVRVDCTNVLPAAIKGAVSVWKMSHTPNVQERINLAMEAILNTVRYQDAFTVAAQAMLDQEMADAEFAAIVERMFPVATGKEETKAGKNALAVRAEMTELYATSETLENVRGSLWGGYNAITEWYDWARPVRQEDAAVARAEGTLAGPYVSRKANVWDRFLAAV